jgi:hypothetical protein
LEFSNGTSVDIKRFPELAPFCKIVDSINWIKLFNHIVTFTYKDIIEKVGIVSNIGLNTISLEDHAISYDIKYITNVQILKSPSSN